jgi:4-diphosphocytidyl-2-C-methyl-D-erythritol kinase
MIVTARAKINLSLDVKGLRGDGYHNILSVMQSLELHDLLELSPSQDIQVFCADDEVPSGPENIVYRVGEIMREQYLYNGGAKITINKKIPVAAGLAGGSADAASAIKALNKLWELNIQEKELYRIAEMAGSDVPFCLLGKTALVSGRGEKLTPLSSFENFGVVLVKPPFGVSTAKIFTLYDNLSPASGPNTASILRALENRDLLALSRLMANGLERVTIGLHPEIQEIKEALLDAGAIGSLMSGSGPTVFGLCQDYKGAVNVAKRLRLPGCRIIATKTI